MQKKIRINVELIDECTETIEETKLTEITPFKNENNYKYGSCKAYIVLMIVICTIFYWNYYLFCLLQLVFD